MGMESKGSTSAILKSENPGETLEEMIEAMKEVWLKTHQH